MFSANAAREVSAPSPEQSDLFEAISKNRKDRVEALVAKGLDLNFSISGMTPHDCERPGDDTIAC